MRSQDNSRHFLIIDLFSKLKDMLKFCNMEPLRSLKLLNLFILAKMCSGSSNSQKKIAFPWSCAYGNKNKVTQNEKKKNKLRLQQRTWKPSLSLTIPTWCYLQITLFCRTPNVKNQYHCFLLLKVKSGHPFLN